MTKNYVFMNKKDYIQDKFRTIAIMSVTEEKYFEACDKLRLMLYEHNIPIDDFELENIETHEEYRIIRLYLDYLSKLIKSGDVKIHVMIWEMEEREYHPIEEENMLKKRYNHLINNFIKTQFDNKDEIYLYNNKNIIINSIRDKLRDSHQLKKIHSDKTLDINPGYKMKEEVIENKKLHFLDKPFENEYLTKVADLFAGIVKLSYDDTRREELEESIWKNEEPKTPCPIRKKIYDAMKRLGSSYGASYKSGFRTKKKDEPVNFWYYRPNIWSKDNDEEKERLDYTINNDTDFDDFSEQTRLI